MQNSIDSLLAALQPLTRLLLDEIGKRAAKDESLRTGLAQLGQQLTIWAESCVTATEPSEIHDQPIAHADHASNAIGLEPNSPPMAEPVLPVIASISESETQHQSLKSLDRSAVDVDVTHDNGSDESERGWPSNSGPLFSQITRADLVWIQARCRMKAEAARWGAERMRRIAQGANAEIEIVPIDRDMLRRAGKLPECFVWTHKLSLTGVGVPDDYDRLAGNFDAAAEALGLAEFMLDREGEDDLQLSNSLYLLAETQSALRASVQYFAPDWKYDNDQILIFQWLRQIGRERNIFISQYMRLDDMANSDDWQNRIDRIHHMQAEARELAQSALAEQQQAEAREQAQRQQIEQRAKRIQELLGAIKYHSKVILRDSNSPGANLLHDWRRIVDAASEMVTLGIPPSNVDVRTALLPVVDLMPASLETGREFDLVLREIDAYLALQEQEQANPVESASGSADVIRATEMLRGKALVLIGGDRRPHTAEALEKAFGLSELIWIATRSHQSYTIFEPEVARADVAAVVLAIRWASHGFGEVKSVCDKYGKPLVRLPAGYNPNQVAAQIVSQAGERLALV